MTSQEIAKAVAQMQVKIKQRTEEMWQNENGTFSHRYDARRQWRDRVGCETDLRFTKEWER